MINLQSYIMLAMKKVITVKKNWEEFFQTEKFYKNQKQFPSLPEPYTDRIQPILHTGYLMFIRNKFLHKAIASSFKEKNLYASYALLKAYWENTIAFGYYVIHIKQYLESNNTELAFRLSRKMALGGRGFVTVKMATSKGKKLKDFTIPSITKMMNSVDNEWKTKMKIKDSITKELYDSIIAEGGHTTYVGLWISGRKLPDGSGLADVKKSWSKWEESSILKLVVMASKILQLYWKRFLEVQENYPKTG